MSKQKSLQEKIEDVLRARVPEAHWRQVWDMLEQLEREDVSDWERHYARMPVDIEEFVKGKYYLNKAAEVYPKVMEDLWEINSGKYVEVVLTGGIGSAKTTRAIYTQAYQLYLCSCLRNPHATFGLDRSSEILLIFQNLSEKLARGVDFNRFKHMIKESKYFSSRFPYDKWIDSKLVFPNRIEVTPVSGTETATIGQNVMGGIIDELNYMAVTDKSKLAIDQGTYDQAIALYNSIARRRKTRFMEMGKMPGILCLVSSKRYPGQFTDQKEEEARTDPTIYVSDLRVWDVKPEGSFGEGRFQVFIGDETRKPRIMSDDEVVEAKDRGLVDHIPHEFRAEFEKDIINALREIAGKSTLAKHPYFTNIEAVSASMGKVASVFSREDVDFVTTQLQLFPGRIQNPTYPRFAHVDLAISSDSAGVAIGYVPQFVRVKRAEAFGEPALMETLPIIQIDGVLEVRPPKGGEILFWKIRNVFYVLRQLGMNLKWVTFDSFQSTDSMQMLRQKGFLTAYTSMDTTPAPYDMLKSAVYDGRMKLPYHPKLLKEMASLEKDPKTGKIDHPPRGSKDLADALAGVAYGLTMRREVWAMFGIPPNQLPKSVLAMVDRQQNYKSSMEAKENVQILGT